jgi:hypothetical protein
VRVDAIAPADRACQLGCGGAISLSETVLADANGDFSFVQPPLCRDSTPASLPVPGTRPTTSRSSARPTDNQTAESRLMLFQRGWILKSADHGVQSPEPGTGNVFR